MTKELSIKIIFAVLLLGSCKSSTIVEFIEFPVSKNLNFEEIDITNILAIPGDVKIAMPGEITIHNDMIIVWDQETDWFFKIFTFEDFEYLGSLVRKGRGPDEEIDLAPFIRPHMDNILYQGTGNIKIARVNNYHNELALEVVQVYELPAEMFDDYDIFMLNGKLYSSNGFRHIERDFQGFCIETGKLFEWGEKLPLSNSQISKLNQLRIPLTKYTTVIPDSKLIATVYDVLPVIRIYEAENGHLVSEWHKTDRSSNLQILLDNSADHIQDGLVRYYSRIKSTNDYIYALYSGKPVGDLPKNNVIHVLDWEGNTVMRFNLNISSITSFDISPDNRHIVAISILDTNKIFRAEIPWD